MQGSAENEGKETGFCFCLAPSDYRLQVAVTVEEHMHRPVPFTVELLIASTVPPVLIKLAMVKPRDLCK